MTRDEAIKMLQVTRLMLMDGANQPISDLYYALDMAIEALEQTENSSEKPNNCEHITEDGVTCAKYPACDYCLDNPLNKVKGSKRLLKGKTEPQRDCFLCKWLGDVDVCGRCRNRNLFAEADTEPTISKMEQVEDEPMKTTDYCDICKRDMCEYCIADATNPYCVPSHYEINYEPKDEPKTQTETQNSNSTFEKADEPQTDCPWK